MPKSDTAVSDGDIMKASAEGCTERNKLNFLRAARNLLSQPTKCLEVAVERGSCTLEPSNFCSSDWASMAPDVLRQIFSIRQPLQLELRLVCHAWASAFMPLLMRLTVHSGVWKHSRLGSSSTADLARLTKFCNLTQLDLIDLIDLHSEPCPLFELCRSIKSSCLRLLNFGLLCALPPLPRLRELKIGHTHLCLRDLQLLRMLLCLDTLHLEIKKATRSDITPLQELHSLRCLAVTLHPEWRDLDGRYVDLVNIASDNFLVKIGERGGLTQLTGFTVLAHSVSLNEGYSSKPAQYGWMRNLRSLELAAVWAEEPHQRRSLNVIVLTELRRLCEQAPQLRNLAITARRCDVHLAECLTSLTGLTALGLTTSARDWECMEVFQQLPLNVVTSLFWGACIDIHPHPFQLCANLVSLVFWHSMTGDQIRHLLQLTQLRSLELRHGIKHSCTPAQISNLGRLTGLSKLQFGLHSDADPLDCVRAIGKLSRLNQLGLNMTWLTYQAMALRDCDCLGSLRGLSASMGVRIWNIQGAMSLEPLLGMTNLTRLELSQLRRKHCALSAPHQLAALTSLRELVIHRSRLADADAPFLASLTQLTHLRMVGKNSKASGWIRTKHKPLTDTLSKLPQLLYFSTVSND